MAYSSPPSSRSSSLPPLRGAAPRVPRGDGEDDASGFPGMNLKKRSRVLLHLDSSPGGDRGGGGGGGWSQRPPRPQMRTEELFRNLSAMPLQGAAHYRATSRGVLPRTPRSGDGDPFAPEPSVRTSAGNSSVAVTASGPPIPKPSRRRDNARLRSVKAVFLGDAGYPGESELDSFTESLMESSGGESVFQREARLRREVAALRTGEDAIKFFTRYGTDSTVEVKLLYCARPPSTSESQDGSPGDVGPYDLWIVPSPKAGAEYWTISASGVVHFRPGELSECTPLGEWMQHTLMYRVLTSMAFFRLYPQRKTLQQWRANARHIAYCRSRARMARHCFLAKPLFVAPVMRARRAIYEAGRVQFVRCPETCMQLHDFSEMQAACVGSPTDGARVRLDRRYDEVAALLDGLLVNVGKAVERDSAPPSRERSLFGNEKGKAMVQEKREAQERQRRLRIAKEDEAMTGGCVRLMDFMLQAQVVDALVRSAAAFRSRIEAPSQGEAPKKLFALSIRIKAGAVDLSPAASDFDNALRQMWQEMVGTAGSLASLAAAQVMMRHGLDNRSRTPLAEILANSAGWRAATAGASNAVAASLRDALNHVRAELVAPCAAAEAFGRGWSEAAYKSSAHTADGLAEDIGRVRKVLDDLGRCRAQRVFGAVYLDARGPRDSLTTIPQAALGVMKQTLANLARDRCLETTRRFEAVLKAVDDRPKDPVGAALNAYAKTYAWAVGEQTALEAKYEEVVAMYDQLRQHGHRVSLDDQVSFDKMLARERDLTHRAMLEARLLLDKSRPQRPSTASSDGESVAAESPPAPPRQSVTITVEAQIEDCGQLTLMNASLGD